MRLISLVAFAFLLGTASRGFAQSPDFSDPAAQQVAPPVSHAATHDQSTADPAQLKELQQWMDDFTAWKAWWAAWANRHEPGWFTSSRQRREKPAPPEWLAARCADVFDDRDVLKPACRLLAEWREEDFLTLWRYANAAVVQKQEAGTKTIWWEHIHIDLLWPATQVRSSVYGVIGIHTATTVKGRVQVFLGPGVMLLNLPASDGTRVWKVAADYGIGYRLFDFTMPGNRRASLHVNVAKSWMVSNAADLIVERNMEFAGFSITMKKR